MAYAGHLWFKTRGVLEPLPVPEWASEITQRRAALGLSKTRLAEAANVGRATLYCAERGFDYVTDRTRERIGAALERLEAAAAQAEATR